MPSRAIGSEVIIYLEHEDKWVDAEVVDYIRGFGYEVSFELDGLSQSGKNLKKMQFSISFHLKVLLPGWHPCVTIKIISSIKKSKKKSKFQNFKLRYLEKCLINFKSKVSLGISES